MKAFAAKNIKGDIVQLYMTKPSSVPFPLTCVTVTVSENGDVDELLREVLDWGLPDDLKQRIDAYLSRKELK